MHHTIPGDPRVAEAWETILRSLGYDLTDPHLRETPARVARFMRDFHTLGIAPPELTVFPNPVVAGGGGLLHRLAVRARLAEPMRVSRGLVLMERVVFHSLCAHHGLPFVGEALVGYIPADKVLGLSKFARTIDHFARRFTTQETMSEDIATYLDDGLHPVGLGVLTRAEHLCTSMRGIQKPGHRTTYSALRGALYTKPEARAEFMAIAMGR